MLTQVVKEIDDHADFIYVETITDCSGNNRVYNGGSGGGGHKKVTRKMCFSRFWKLEDDGVSATVLVLFVDFGAFEWI